MKSTSGARGAVAAAVGRLDGVARSAWFAYGSILLIQAKVLWGIWEHRDLTGGDTTQYFIQASRWTHGFHLDPVWSPLYDFFWGSLRWFVDDPYASTIAHRVLIVIAATVLVLAVLRRLLSPGIAWALAVWWAILPINYDVLYEVHLFALLPELLAVLIALTWTGLRMRAGVFGVLLAATVLVRNEVAVALAVWTVAWVAYEVRATRRGAGTGAQRLAVAAAAPVLAIGAVTGALALSYPNGDLAHRFQAHEELSVCQAYAVGYQQRHDDFRANPFSGCGRLMARDFGKPMPSMIDAIGANPGAIGAHYLWNAQLLPYGLQLMLFDRISAGGQNRDPDYLPVKAGSTTTAIGSLLLLGFVLGGLLLLWRDRQRWWRTWLAPRAWGWLALLALAATATLAALWQRPRPEYLYALSVAILALIGMCAMAYADRWPASKRIRAAIPIAADPARRSPSGPLHVGLRHTTGRSTWTATEGVGRSPLPDPDRAARGRRQAAGDVRRRGVRLPRRGRPVRSGLLEADPRRRAEWRGRGSPGGAPGRLHLSRRGGTPASLLPGGGPGG